MPYDKGDFTQQGIDGKVAGGLLLNNKRDGGKKIITLTDVTKDGELTLTLTHKE